MEDTDGGWGKYVQTDPPPPTPAPSSSNDDGGWGAYTQTPAPQTTTTTVEKNWPGAEAYLSALPYDHPDRAGIANWLSLAKQGNPEAIKFLDEAKFPTANPAATSVPSGDTSKPYTPPGLIASAYRGAKSGLLGATASIGSAFNAIPLSALTRGASVDMPNMRNDLPQGDTRLLSNAATQNAFDLAREAQADAEEAKHVGSPIGSALASGTEFLAGSAGYFDPFTAPVQAFGQGRNDVLAATGDGILERGDEVKANYVGAVSGAAAAVAHRAGTEVGASINPRIPNAFRAVPQNVASATAFMAPEPLATATVAGDDPRLQEQARAGIQALPEQVGLLGGLGAAPGLIKGAASIRGADIAPAAEPLAEAAAIPDSRPGRRAALAAAQRERQIAANEARDAQLAQEGTHSPEDLANPIENEPHPLLDQGPIPKEVVQRESFPKPAETEAEADIAPYAALRARVVDHAQTALGLDRAAAEELGAKYEEAKLIEDGFDPDQMVREARAKQVTAKDLKAVAAPEPDIVEPVKMEGVEPVSHEVLGSPREDLKATPKPDQVEGGLRDEPVMPAKEAVTKVEESRLSEPLVGRSAVPVEDSKQGAPAARGDIKRRLAEKMLFGEQKDPVKYPSTFTPGEARIFKDAGKSRVSVLKLPGEQFSLLGHESGKVLIGRPTDARGRPVPALGGVGVELRPVDVRGQPVTIDYSKGRSVINQHRALLFDSVEEAAHYAINNFTEATHAPSKDAEHMVGNSEVQGELVQTRVAKGSVDKGEKALRDEHAASKAELQNLLDEIQRHELPTEKQFDRVGALVDRINQIESELSKYDDTASQPSEPKLKAETPTIAEMAQKKAVDSPLAPRTREGLKEDLPDEEMSPAGVAKLVGNALEKQLKKPPTPAQVRAALRDLADHGLVTEAQTKGPIEGQGKVLGGFADPATALLVSTLPVLGIQAKRLAHSIIQNAKSDLPDWVGAGVNRAPGPKPGEFGSRGRVVGNFLARTVFGGKMGPKVIDALGKLENVFQARYIAALHPEFRPILDRVRAKIDNERQAFIKAYEPVEALENLPEDSRDRVSKALVYFRVDQTDSSKFGDPFKFSDEQGVIRTYKLTPDEINVVNQIHDGNQKLLELYVDAARKLFGVGRNMTAADVTAGVKNGTLPASASTLIEALRTLEAENINYVPFVRYGGYKRAVAYDAQKYNLARTAQDRKDAEIALIRGESAEDYRKQMTDLRTKHPTAHIVEYADGPQDIKNDGPVGITEGALRELADKAGVPYQVFQDFWDAGIGDAIRTKRLRARFREARMIEGMSMDMVRVNAEHALKMTRAIESMKYRPEINDMLSKIKDPGLKDYANRFVTRVEVPPTPVASTLRHLAVLHYMGGSLTSAALNSSTALLFSPISVGLATRSPKEALAHFATSVRAVSGALTYSLGAPHIMKMLGAKRGGSDMVDWAIRHYAKEPALAAAMKDAHEKGTFNDQLTRLGEQTALGKESGWADKASHAFMHFFSKTEQANRIATFVAAYRIWEDHKTNKPFLNWADNMGFTGKNAADFARWYSDLQNNRQDRTDAPQWAQGHFKTGKDGQPEFTGDTWRQAAYALQSWNVDFIHLKLMEARAAWKGGWIDRAAYAAITTGLIGALGIRNTIPGLNAEDAIEKAIARNPESTQDRITRSGPLGRLAMKGAAGSLAEALTGSHKVAEFVEALSGRVGPGNMVPVGTATDIFPVLGMGANWLRSAEELSHPQTGWDRAESLAGLVGSEAKRVVRGARMLATDDGYTSHGKTVVPDASKAAPGAPAITTMDKVAYLAGQTPPQVTHQYELKDAIQTMKTSNDAFFNMMVEKFSAVALDRTATDEEKQAALLPLGDAIKENNERALAEHEPWKMVLPDALARAIKQNVIQSYTGNVQLKQAPKESRAELFRLQQQLQRGDEVAH